MAPRLQPLLLKYQPQAVCFNGAGLSPNPARWCGTEGDVPPGDGAVWSTDCPGIPYPDTGCEPNSTGAFWNPSGLDYTMQVSSWAVPPAEGGR